METPKTAEEVLGETYSSLAGSGKNFIIKAMEEYASIKAKQARREEESKLARMVEQVQVSISAMEKRHQDEIREVKHKHRALVFFAEDAIKNEWGRWKDAENALAASGYGEGEK